MKINLLTDAQLTKIVETSYVDRPDNVTLEQHKVWVVMAMEILEYRKAYGPLGCEYLENADAPTHDPDCDGTCEIIGGTLACKTPIGDI